jgi:membrane protease YdiL (CAAX protease family)
MQDANEGNTKSVAKSIALGTIVSTVGVTSYFAFQTERAGERSFWVLAAAPVLVFAVAALFLSGRHARLWQWVKPKSGDFSIGFFAAGVLFAAAYAFSKIVTGGESARAMWLARIYLQTGDPTILRAHPTVLLFGLILAAAAEEIVWRGVVLSLLEERVGERYAWAASAVLYALAYVPTMWSLESPRAGLDPVLPLAALFLGLALGWLVKRFERLLPAVVAHALFAWAVLVMFRLWGDSL